MASCVYILFNVGARGGNFDLASGWVGWIDEFRLTVGESAYALGVNFTPRKRAYQFSEPTLISRYGKTGQPNIKLSEHRIQNDESIQGTRDKLSNQIAPKRSLPQSQTVVARGTAFDEVWVTLTFPGGVFYSDTDVEDDWFFGVPY